MLIDELKTILTPYLGKFKALNLPAIAVESSNYSKDITGILCLVPYISSTSPIKLLSGDNYHIDTYKIRLINYDTTPSLKLSNCLQAIQNNYDVISQSYTSGDTNSELFEQMNVTIQTYKITSTK
jgi:hypothetical protein